MFCKQCGNKLEEGAKFCNGCGAAVTPENNNVQSVQPTQASSNDNTKVFKVLSYFGLLFLIGMFVKEKDDKSVRFHVGQGMILCIAGVATSIVYSIISAIAVAFSSLKLNCTSFIFISKGLLSLLSFSFSNTECSFKSRPTRRFDGGEPNGKNYTATRPRYGGQENEPKRAFGEGRRGECQSVEAQKRTYQRDTLFDAHRHLRRLVSSSLILLLYRADLRLDIRHHPGKLLLFYGKRIHEHIDDDRI